MSKEPGLENRKKNNSSNKKKEAIHRLHLHPSLVTGVVVTLATVYGLTVAYRNVLLVNAIMETGVPVVYYGQAMVLLIGCAIGVGAALVAWYLGGAKHDRPFFAESGKEWPPRESKVLARAPEEAKKY